MPLAREQLIPKIRNRIVNERTIDTLIQIVDRFGLDSGLAAMTEDDDAAAPKFRSMWQGSPEGKLAAVVGAVLGGNLNPNFFISHLEQKLSIGREKAREIALEVSKQIFLPVRQELAELYNIQPVAPVVASAAYISTPAPQPPRPAPQAPSESAVIARPPVPERRTSILPPPPPPPAATKPIEISRPSQPFSPPAPPQSSPIPSAALPQKPQEIPRGQ